MMSSHSMCQHSQSSAVPSANSQTFLSMVGLSLASSEGSIFNVTVLYSSSLLMGFCVLSCLLLERNRQRVHGGMSMVLAVFWDVSQLHFPLSGVNSLCPMCIEIKIEVLL